MGILGEGTIQRQSAAVIIADRNKITLESLKERGMIDWWCALSVSALPTTRKEKIINHLYK